MTGEEFEMKFQGKQGERGETGKQGERGEQGLSPQVRRAIIGLFIFTVVLSALNLFWTAYLVRSANQAKCATVLTLAHLPAPVTRFDRALTAAFVTRAAELGCKEDHP